MYKNTTQRELKKYKNTTQRGLLNCKVQLPKDRNTEIEFLQKHNSKGVAQKNIFQMQSAFHQISNKKNHFKVQLGVNSNLEH